MIVEALAGVARLYTLNSCYPEITDFSSSIKSCAIPGQWCRSLRQRHFFFPFRASLFLHMPCKTCGKSDHQRKNSKRCLGKPVASPPQDYHPAHAAVDTGQNLLGLIPTELKQRLALFVHPLDCLRLSAVSRAWDGALSDEAWPRSRRDLLAKMIVTSGSVSCALRLYFTSLLRGLNHVQAQKLHASLSVPILLKQSVIITQSEISGASSIGAMKISCCSGPHLTFPKR